MRRLLRWSVPLAAAVSAVLCVGICVLWVRGRRTHDVWYGTTAGGTLWEVGSGERLWLATAGGWPRPEPTTRVAGPAVSGHKFFTAGPTVGQLQDQRRWVAKQRAVYTEKLG